MPTGRSCINCSRSPSLVSRAIRNTGAAFLPHALVYVSAPTAGACDSIPSPSSQPSESSAFLCRASTIDDYGFARTDGRTLGTPPSVVASASWYGTSSHGTSFDRRGHVLDHLHWLILARLACAVWLLANRFQSVSAVAERREMDASASGFPTARTALLCLNSRSVVVVLDPR